MIGRCLSVLNRPVVAISSWMLPVPVPRRLDDRPQLGVLWFPAELALDFFGCRNQGRRITGAPRAFLDRNRFAGHFFGDADHFADTVTTASADVVVEFLAVFELLEREQVGLG